MDYGFVHNGKVFTPNGTADVNLEENAARNAGIEAADLARWQTQPEWFLAYYHEPSTEAQQSGQASALGRINWTVQTWTGVVIGRVTEYRVYRHNFGGRMVSLRVKGNNGAEYYGRASYDWGNVVKLRKVKG